MTRILETQVRHAAAEAFSLKGAMDDEVPSKTFDNQRFRISIDSNNSTIHNQHRDRPDRYGSL